MGDKYRTKGKKIYRKIINEWGQLVRKHYAVLDKEFDEKVYNDKYGEPVLDGFDKELDYFCSKFFYPVFRTEMAKHRIEEDYYTTGPNWYYDKLDELHEEIMKLIEMRGDISVTDDYNNWLDKVWGIGHCWELGIKNVKLESDGTFSFEYTKVGIYNTIAEGMREIAYDLFFAVGKAVEKASSEEEAKKILTPGASF